MDLVSALQTWFLHLFSSNVNKHTENMHIHDIRQKGKTEIEKGQNEKGTPTELGRSQQLNIEFINFKQLWSSRSELLFPYENN